MKRGAILLSVLLLMGCSTHPLVDFLDFVAPGRIRETRNPPYGGVGNQNPLPDQQPFESGPPPQPSSPF